MRNKRYFLMFQVADVNVVSEESYPARTAHKLLNSIRASLGSGQVFEMALLEDAKFERGDAS